MLSRSLRLVIRRLDREEGLSLTELAIVSALLLVVIVPATQFIVTTQRNERIVSEATRQQQDARTGMETFSRSLREANYPEGLTYTESSIFGAAAQNDVTYYADADGDGVTEKVRYELDAANAEVKRTVTEPNCAEAPCSYTNGATSSTNTVVSYVRNANLAACNSSGSKPLFTYYQLDPGTGGVTEIPTPAPGIDALVDINYVKLQVVADVTPGKSPTCQTLETAVSLRNWRG